MVDVAKLIVGISARGAVAGARTFKKALAGMGMQTKKTSGQMRSFGSSMKTAFAAIGGAVALKQTITTIAGFEDQMAMLQGTTGATADEMEQFKNRARELGASTRFSASQAAEGLLELSRAGFEVEESIAAIGSTLDLATAAQLELGQASAITANTIRQYSLAAEDAQQVSDVFVNTANSSNTTVEALAETMKFAGATAGTLGISLEETAAAAGALANSGIKGSMAGTSLRGMMLSLVKPTEEAKQQIEDLGLTMDQVNPEKVGIIGAFKALRESQMDTAAATTIFQKRFAGSALILSKNINMMEKLKEANEDAEGTARKNAKLMEETLSGAWLTFKSAVEEAMLQTGDAGFLGVLKDVVKFATDVVRVLSGVEGAVSKPFLKGQIAMAKFIGHFKTGLEIWKGIFKIMGTVADHFGKRIANVYIAIGNTITGVFKLVVMDLIQDISDFLEKAQGIASFFSQDATNAIAEARIAVGNFKDSSRDAMNALQMEYKEVGVLSEDLKTVTAEMKDKVLDVEIAQNKVTQELEDQLTAMEQQENHEKRLKEAAEKRAEAEREVNEAMREQQEAADERGRRALEFMDMAEEIDEKIAKSTEKNTEAAEKFKIKFEDVADSVASSLTDAALGAKSFGDALRDLSDQLVRMAVQRAIMASISGGTPAPAARNGLVAMANGGVVRGPTPALIGEAGPEAVIPLQQDERGRLGIASGGGGGEPQQVNFVFNSPDARGVKDMMLKDPKFARQLNETMKQGYVIS